MNSCVYGEGRDKVGSRTQQRLELMSNKLTCDLGLGCLGHGGVTWRCITQCEFSSKEQSNEQLMVKISNDDKSVGYIKINDYFAEVGR
jgi:hypothetical protein